MTANQTTEKIVYDENLQSAVFELLLKKQRDRATEHIVNAIKKHKHIYTTRDDEKSEMWIYQDGIYVPQARTHIKEFCREVLGEIYTTHLSNQVIAKIEADTYIEQEEFFTNENIEEIAVQNGILNIRTRELLPFTPNKIFFNKIPVTYDPTKESININTFFKQILKEPEDIKVMYELFGYLLLKEYKYEKAFMLNGTDRNGKSKTLELMKHFVGPDNCANIPIQDLETDGFALGELFGKLANLAGDINKTALKNTGNFKNLTGRDLISASRKFLNKVHFQNYAKMIFAANELPETKDHSPAFWERWVLFDYPHRFVSKQLYDELDEEQIKKGTEDGGVFKIQHPEIIDEIVNDDELSGLLNVSLDGLDRLSKNNSFSTTRGKEEVKRM